MSVETSLPRSRRSTLTSLAFLALIPLLGGCGSTTPPPADDAAPREAGVLPDAGSGEGGTLSREGGTSPDGGTGVQVTVIYAGQNVLVDLGWLEPVSLDGTTYVRISAAVQRALPGKPLDSLQADFESVDGYQPAKKDFCKDLIPVTGATLAKGYIHTVSRNMRWDDDLAYPGCMAAKELGLIKITDR